jgi:hypothetical protein
VRDKVLAYHDEGPMVSSFKSHALDSQQSFSEYYFVYDRNSVVTRDSSWCCYKLRNYDKIVVYVTVS